MFLRFRRRHEWGMIAMNTKRALIHVGLASLAFTSYASLPATAQVIADGVNKNISDIEAKLENNNVGVDTAGVGVVVMPGLIWVPNAFLEGGYDSNPDQLYDQEGSAFTRTGVGFALTKVSQDTLAQFTASGSWLGYAEDIQPDSRLGGSVGTHLVHRLMPGVSLRVESLYEHDATKRVETDTAGVSSEISFAGELVSGFVRGRAVEARYDKVYQTRPVPDPSIAPLFLASAFDATKTEVSGGVIFYPNHSISPYVEGGAAVIDYTNQKLTAIVDRDAEASYVKSGFRFRVSPSLTADLGGRWNFRNTNQSDVGSYNVNGFDGALTWTPSRYFSLTASVERIIGEPTSAYGVLADMTTYELKANYVLMPGVTVTLAGEHIRAKELGNDFSYHSNVIDGLVVFEYSQHVQFYTDMRYEHFGVDWENDSFSRFKALAGIRIIPDGADLTKQASTFANRLDVPHLPKGADLTISSGYSMFELPGYKSTVVVGGPFFDQSLNQLTDQDGKASGGRVDMQLANFAQYAVADGQTLSFSLSGFYGHYAGSNNTYCHYTDSTDCAFVNIVDFDTNEENNTGTFGILTTKTKRDVDYYGVSIDTRLGDIITGSIKDSIPDLRYSPIKVGLSARGLNDRTVLTSSDPGVCLPVRFDDKLNTQYYGGYIGVVHQIQIVDGWSANFDGQAGLYLADTTYKGRYAGYVPVISPFVGFAGEHGSVDESKSKGAFIGALRLGLNRDLGWGMLGFYGQMEYLSYAPGVAHNTNDVAGGSPWGLQGAQSGTRIVSDDAINYTGGLSLTIKLD